ncbi:hypothetical protein [Scytonema sp. HK-05]
MHRILKNVDAQRRAAGYRQDEPALQEGFPTAGDWRRQERQEWRLFI